MSHSATPGVTGISNITPGSRTQSSRRVAAFLQDACLRHRYIRSRDFSAIVERPERMRAVIVGLSAALSRLGETFSADPVVLTNTSTGADTDDLTAALNRLNLAANVTLLEKSPVSIVQSMAFADILNHPAVKFVHGDIQGDTYLENIKNWARDSKDKILKEGSEIPQGLAQGDLYLCPESIDAIQGAIGTVCEAVDTVVKATLHIKDTAESGIAPSRAFVAIRPPGHHCGEDTPSGFCFVNNVVIAAAHAHLQHGINRVVIFDIDLHHGNGTQSIAWQINEETYRQTLESEAGAPASKRGPQIYYGSIHDIQSYPCEDGKPDLVQAASTSIHSAHGQHIENIHLQTYTSESHFWDVLYKERYTQIFRRAEEFLDSTGGPGDDAIVFISCGFDASEHEYTSMSRHNRKVPTSFFQRFAVDAGAFADRYANGRLVSVLEGGYSDRALTSGTFAHLCGLAQTTELPHEVVQSWWSVDNLEKLEKATKKQRRGKQSLSGAESTAPWLEKAVAIFASLDPATHITPSSSRATASVVPPSSRTLRERKKPSSASVDPSPASSPPRNKHKSTAGKPETTKNAKHRGVAKAPIDAQESDSSLTSSIDSLVSARAEEAQGQKKLPRVILRLGPHPGAS